MHEVEIAGRKVGAGQPCFIIAEAGVNHNGDMDIAHRLVDVAVASGADAIKFQTFKAERLVTENAPKADYQLRTTGVSESLYEMLQRLELSVEAHHDLMAYAREKGIIFMSTPFDEQSADFLAELGLEVFKTPSGDLTNLPFLEHVASKGKPVIISTGMSCLGEVEAAVNVFERAGNEDIILLHCTSSYPASPEDVNLFAMQTMARAFNHLAGYSDHTLGIEIPLAAVALGAKVIEKHITLDRHLPGPDQSASLEPDELAAMVRGIRKIERALGSGRKTPARCEVNTALVARKSLIAAMDIPAGAVIKLDMIAIKRPGTGLVPSMRDFLTGRTARISIPKGTVIRLEMMI